MKPSFRIPPYLPIAFAILCSSRVMGQILVHTDIETLNKLDRSRVEGVFVSDNDLFCVVADRFVLDRTGQIYDILDSDPTTGTYYWILPNRLLSLEPEEIAGISHADVLWKGEDRILVRASSDPQIWGLSPDLSAVRVQFQKPLEPRPIRPENRFEHPVAADSDWIQPILDAVHLDSLLLTVNHLSGEESYLRDGTPDSIMTRFSYSPGIFKAQDYLESRLAAYGYTVEAQMFAASTFSGLRFAKDRSSVGWLIAEGKIYGTSDNGNSWSLQYENPEITDLSCLASFDSWTALAVGEGGAVVRTRNAGATWETVISPTSDFLFNAFFLDDGSAWICGDQGALYRTSDCGETWDKPNVPVSPRLRALYFLSSEIGYAAGDSGLILRTRDGGKIWYPLTSGVSETITSIHFLDGKTGWAVGRNGTVLRTSDSGDTWTPVLVPKSARFEDIRFFDGRRGIILGSDNTALWTQDGGTTWKSLNPLPGDDLVSADMNGSNLWVLGRNNLAFRLGSGSGWEKSTLEGTTVMINNLITQKTGTVYPDQYWIICAHYDATSMDPYYRTPGADDNASGCAAVIEAARILAHYYTEYSIRFVFFSGEEQGLVGSRAYALDASAAQDNIRGVINLDMVAWDGDDNRVCQIHCGSDGSSYNIGELMQIAATDYGLNLSVGVRTYDSTNRSDHASFWNVGYPAVLLIEDMSWDFNPFYHSIGDTSGWFNRPYFLDNTRLALAGLASLAVIDSADSGAWDTPTLPEEMTFYPAYPNPFNPNVFFRYELPSADEVRLVVFDVLGRPMKTLYNGTRSEGRYRAVWNGIDENGRLCPSGVYVVSMITRNRTATQKIVLVR